MNELSVVIPTYNTAAMTLRCVRAVTGADEVIVVDDGSTDGTAELLAREAPAVRVIRLDQNSGFAVAANRGVESATGRIVLLLNSDAIVQPGALEALVRAFDDPMLDVAGAQLVNPDGTPQWSGGRTPTLLWMMAVVTDVGRVLNPPLRRVRGPVLHVDWVSGAAMAFRRASWTPFTTRYRFYCQDLEFCLGRTVRIVPKARVVHELGGTTGRDIEATLWPDLLDWGHAHYGNAWFRVARVVLASIAWLRGFRRAAEELRKTR